MQTVTFGSTAPRVPIWLWAAAVFGVVWNLYGTYQYIGTFTQAGQAAMTAGMTPAQAAVYLALPAWVSAVFAVGVFGVLAGSMLLALRRASARPVFAVSLVGYGLLFAGDAAYGVFAVIPSQLAILAAVVLIAATLLGVTSLARKRGLLN